MVNIKELSQFFKKPNAFNSSLTLAYTDKKQKLHIMKNAKLIQVTIDYELYGQKVTKVAREQKRLDELITLLKHYVTNDVLTEFNVSYTWISDEDKEYNIGN